MTFGVLADLDPDELEIVAAVATWVDREVRRRVRDLEHDDSYPEHLIDAMKQLGVFGLLVPAEFGGIDVSVRCFAAVVEELARGWMSLAGAMGGHSVVVSELRRYGTREQQEQYLRRWATGELRATMALTEPGGGSDLQAMRTVARREGDELVLDGSKTWITNAERSGLCAVLCKTDPDADPPHRGMSVVLVEKGPGFTVGRALPKLGYKGVESCELFFDGCRVPADAILGAEPGRGFAQMMAGLEIGRIHVAARATGVARAAFDDALAYAEERHSFGVPIWRHQSVGNHLATMGTKITAARALVQQAAAAIDRLGTANLEAGMAKLFASEVCAEVALTALRVHGGMGYSTELDIERYYRDAPLMIVGEGTNDIQLGVIARELVGRGSLP